jgi:hypothetical protein
MAITADLKKSLTNNPAFTAVAGATDFAIDKVREVPARLKALRVDVKDTPKDLQARLAVLPGQFKELPKRAQAVASDVTVKAVEAYGDLAERGADVVVRLRGQKPSTTSSTAGTKSSAAVEKASPTSVRRTQSAKKAASKPATQSASKPAAKRVAKAPAKATAKPAATTPVIAPVTEPVADASVPAIAEQAVLGGTEHLA